MNKEKTKDLAYLFAAILGGILLAFLFARYIFIVILPFLIAWAIAFGMRPVAATLHRYIRLPQRILRLILTLLCTLVVLGLLVLGIWRLSEELWRFISSLSEDGELKSIITQLTSGGLLGEMFGEVGQTVADALYKLAMSLLEILGRLVSGWIGALPRAFLFLIITVISSVYFALDLEVINGLVRRMLPERIYCAAVRFKRGFLSVGVRYIRSYLVLMLVTFAVMLVGMLVLGVPYALLVAVLLALLDLLPIFGVGTAIIPWSIVEFIFGGSSRGIGLLILYGIHTVIRQFAEPKILGRNLGIHPIITLLFIYVGYSLFGFVGILVGPILTVLFDIAFGEKNTPEVAKSAVAESDDS